MDMRQSEKKAVRVWGAVLAAGILFLSLGLSAFFQTVPVLAAGESYTYTVRIYAGQQGTFQDGEVITYRGLTYGERLEFDIRNVSLKDGSKYYIKGIRESGKDNATVGATSFLVTGDQDYVVAYGLLNDSVAYTIHYEDEDGNTLMPAETYYGNVGDKPVVAYLYLEGYQPQAYNLTKTLSGNAEENVFTFVYTVASATNQPGGEDTEETVTIIEEDEDEEENTEDNPNGENEEDEGGNPGDEDENNGENEDEETDNPPDIVDLDDNEVPLANDLFNKGREILADGVLLFGGLPIQAKAGIIATVLVAAIIGTWYVKSCKKRKKQYEKQTKQKMDSPSV